MNWDRSMGFYWGFLAGISSVFGFASYFSVNSGAHWMFFAILVVIATVANFAFGA
jgi:hypothetical protein